MNLHTPQGVCKFIKKGKTFAFIFLRKGKRLPNILSERLYTVVRPYEYKNKIFYIV